MKPDLYTKVVLTAIAVLLAVIAWHAPAVRAQNAVPALQFDPEVRRIEVPGGKASLLGRLAIDVSTGNIYGFPTDGNPYPRNLQGDAPAVSKPILLARFDLSGLSR